MNDDYSDKPSTRIFTINDFNGVCRMCLIDLNLDNVNNMAIDDVRDLLDYSVQLDIECPDRLPQNVCVACIEELQRSCEFKRLTLNNDVILKKTLREVDELADEKDDIVIDSYSLIDNDAYITDENGEILSENGNNLAVRLTNENVYSCSHCGNGFIGRDRLTQHEKTHEYTEDIDEKENFTPDLCGTDFQGATTLRTHIKRHEQEPSPVKQCHVDDVPYVRRDHICQSVLLNKDHQAIHKTEIMFAPTVEKVLVPNRHLNSIRGRITDGEKPYECIDCGKRFSLKGHLKMHIRTHTEEKPFSCMVCKRSFSNSSILVRHLRMHSRQRLYKCEICSKQFETVAHLTTHTKIHTDEKPQGKVHLRTHMEEKSYSCKACKRSFTVSSALTRHLKMHSEERTYKCKICLETFNTAARLTRHTMIHTGTRPYECNVCKKWFSRAEKLKVHLRTHTREKFFKCTVCERSFKNSSILARHLRIRHSGNRPYK